MLKYVFQLYFILLSITSLAQNTDSLQVDNEEQTYTMTEELPEFPGGNSELYRFIALNIKYPLDARKKKITGKVIVKFQVKTDGTIGKSEILKSPGHGTEEEALRLLSLMPKWKPGRQHGQNVNVWYVLPIAFQLY